MIYKYTYENDIPVECTLTLRELQYLRELTVEAVQEAAGHFTWQKNNIERLEKEEAKAKANA